MSRSALIGNVTAMLEDAGFLVSERCAVRPKSFDVAARRGDTLLLVKILGNIDAFDGATGMEMRRLSTYLEATPLVIGLRTRDEELKPGVMYLRHGVPVLSPDTALDLFVEDVPPMIYAAPGGLYVNIDGDVIADEREKRDWSIGRLATEIGVSRRTVSKYEDGMNASVEVAARMEDLFETPLAEAVDVLGGADELVDTDPTAAPDADDESLVAVLTRVGFDVHPTSRAPFKAVSEDTGDDENVLTGHSAFTRTAEKRARIMSSLGTVTRTRSVYVVDRATRDAVEGTALIEREEIAAIDNPDDLRELIRDRAENPA